MGQERKGHVLCVQPEEVAGGSNVSEFRHFSEGPLRCNLCGERFASLPEVDALPDCTGWKGTRTPPRSGEAGEVGEESK